MSSKHLSLVKHEDHKKQDGCVCRHEPNFDNPTFPKCAYRPNGYNETLSGSVPHAVPPASKRSLYEHDFTQSKPGTTPIQDNPRARLPAAMESFTQTGRQTKADKEAGKKRETYKNTDPRANAKAWHFVGDNYKVWHLPFAHEYHHVMPDEALSEALDTPEAELLMAAGYNMNAGKNVIILPITRDVAYALMLPKHKGWHKSYNQECMLAISNFKQDISENTPDHGITKDNAGGFRKNLENWQDNQFFVLVTEGRTAAIARRAAAEINKLYKK